MFMVSTDTKRPSRQLTPQNRTKLLLAIFLLSVFLRLGLALYLGDDTNNWLGGTADTSRRWRFAL